MNVNLNERIDEVKASLKEGGKSTGVKYNARIKVSWEGMDEESVMWLALRQLKIRMGTQLANEGSRFEEGKTYLAKDYMPGDRKPRQVKPEDAMAILLANPEALKAFLAKVNQG